MDIQEVRDNIEKLPELIETAEKSFRYSKAQLNYMKEMTKVVLARLMSSLEGSVAQKERQALADESYVTHLVGVRVQEEIVGNRESEYNKLTNQFDAMRSLNKNV